MAHVGSLSGRHPAISCLDMVMCCDNGISHPDEVDPACRAVECACCLNCSHQGTGQIFNRSRRECLDYYFAWLCRVDRDPARLLESFYQDTCAEGKASRTTLDLYFSPSLSSSAFFYRVFFGLGQGWFWLVDLCVCCRRFKDPGLGSCGSIA